MAAVELTGWDRSTPGPDPVVRSASDVAALHWLQHRRELSLGIEIECVVPDVGALCGTEQLVVVESDDDLLKLVAARLTARLAGLERPSMLSKCRARRLFSSSLDVPDGALQSSQTPTTALVSAEPADWGTVWTATADTSISPGADGGCNAAGMLN